MLLKKKEFFKRKNRAELYLTYRNDYEHLSDLCFEYQNTLKCLDIYLEEYRNKKYIHNYLLNVKATVEDPVISNICSKYKLCTTSKNFTAGVKDHASLYSNINKLSDAIGHMFGTFAFVDYLTNKGLTVRKS